MTSAEAEVSLEDILQPNMLRPATADAPPKTSSDSAAKSETAAEATNPSMMVSFPAEVSHSTRLF